jgi:hypothetical protein
MTRPDRSIAPKLVVAGALIAILLTGYFAGRASAVSAAAPRVFELRTYVAADGKMDALHARFRNHTNQLFQKHGMDLIGYWMPVDGPDAANTLIYILAYPSREARQKSWQGFMNDPQWKQAHAASERDGKLVARVDSRLLTPTEYSAIR